jgi:Alr-MurF fusion protein
MSLKINKIAEITKADWISKSSKENEIENLYTDSRKIFNPENGLFIALVTSSGNGNKFIQDAYRSGIRNFLVSEPVKLKNANVLVAKNTLVALQKIAAFKRKQFDIPVIAITGSNGKTIVKEWLSYLINSEKKVIKSPRSYNSQLGVPLSVWNISANDEIGIFEAGISTTDEMQNLQEVIQPTFGIFTNIGTAHNEGFKNTEEKISEKLKLFKNTEKVMVCADNDEIISLAKTKKLKLFNWSRKGKKADLLIDEIKTLKGQTVLKFSFKEHKKQTLKLQFSDYASIENAINCLAFLVCYFPFQKVKKLLPLFENLPEIEMRLQQKEGINGCILIDDTYSNDFIGLQNALDYQEKHAHGLQKTVIISDILESGLNTKTLYSNLEKLFLSKKIDKIIAIGNEFKSSKKLKIEHFPDTEEFLQNISLKSFKDECILIKGARKFTFEKIVKLLQKKQHETALNINLDALAHNLNVYRKLLKPTTKVMAMVKAFSYGSGTYEIASWLQSQKIDYLAVAYPDEGILLREKGIKTPIMVMNPERNSFEKIIAFNLEPDIYSFSILEEYLTALKNSKTKPLGIHLEIDTGMHRLGFAENDIEPLISALIKNKIKVLSIFSHLVGSDEENLDWFSQKQINTFKNIANTIEKKLGYSILKHILNSAGIAAFPQSQFDMVRLGIGLYGIDPRNKIKNLQQVGTLKSTISQIFELDKSETVGYNRKGILKKKAKIATIAIGYADGYNRKFGNGVGKMIVNGKIAYTIGNICMDMCMIDISGINASEGDEVIIFGENLAVTEMAKSINTISYEILTNISQRVKRIFYSS